MHKWYKVYCLNIFYNIQLPHFTKKMAVCWEYATDFQFNVPQIAHLLVEEIIGYSYTTMCVALAQSYLAITCNVACNILLLLYNLGEVKFTDVV